MHVYVCVIIDSVDGLSNISCHAIRWPNGEIIVKWNHDIILQWKSNISMSKHNGKAVYLLDPGFYLTCMN